MGGLWGTSEHRSHRSWPWKEKGVIGGCCYPSSCNMAKAHLSLGVVNLHLNPRRGRCVLGGSAPQHICWGPVMPFLSSCIQGLMVGLISGQCQQLPVFQHCWMHLPLPPESPVSPGAARIGLVCSCLPGEATVAAVNHPRSVFAGFPWCHTQLPRSADHGAVVGKGLALLFLLELAPQGPGRFPGGIAPLDMSPFFPGLEGSIAHV